MDRGILKQELKELVDVQKFLKKNRKVKIFVGIMERPEGNYEVYRYRDKDVMMVSAKITFLHYLLNHTSTSGDNGNWTHSNVKISDIDNKDIRIWLKKLKKKLRKSAYPEILHLDF
jgi:hypothetical protein